MRLAIDGYMGSITVAWPAAPLGEARWRTRLEELATKAESLIGRPCGPHQAAELAMELVGLLWPVIGAPETIAATCRASLLVGPPGIVAANSAADQLAEVHSRLDAIWEAAQDNPAAGAVSLPVPMLNDLRLPGAPRRGRRPAPAIGAEPDVDVDVDELPEAWRHCLEPLEPITPEPLPVVITPDLPAPAPARLLRPASERCAPRPAPAPRRRRTAPTPAPPGWFTAADVAELLDASVGSVGRWRKDGRLGVEGAGWQQCGRSFYFAPDAVENIYRTRIPDRLDQLVAEVQGS